MASILELRDVSKSYQAVLEGPPVLVLKGVNLALAPQQTVAIVGPSGSGKSTLLHIMGTLDRPTGGQVLFEGHDLAALTEGQLADFRGTEVGFVFQGHHLLPQCTVLENTLLPTLGLSVRADAKSALERAEALLERVGLAARRDHRPGQLSGGERQRVAVVRALINRPKLILADEPTGALDRAAAEELGRLLIELNLEEQVTLVVVTHAADLAARMQRRCRLVDGKLVED